MCAQGVHFGFGANSPFDKLRANGKARPFALSLSKGEFAPKPKWTPCAHTVAEMVVLDYTNRTLFLDSEEGQLRRLSASLRQLERPEVPVPGWVYFISTGGCQPAAPQRRLARTKSGRFNRKTTTVVRPVGVKPSTCVPSLLQAKWSVQV